MSTIKINNVYYSDVFRKKRQKLMDDNIQTYGAIKYEWVDLKSLDFTGLVGEDDETKKDD